MKRYSAPLTLVLEIGPDALTLLAMDDGGAGVLAEGKDSLHGRLRVAKELKRHIFVVFGGFGIVQDRRDLLVVRPAEHELTVVEALLGHQRERLGGDLEKDLSVRQLGGLHQFLGSRNLVVLSGVFAQLEHRGVNLVVLSGVFAQLEHRGVFEFCHKGNDLVSVIIQI